MPHKYTVKVDSYGDVMHCKNAKRHRDVDKPAVTYTDGSMLYYRDGGRYEP